MKKNEYEKMYKLENNHFWFVAKRFFIETYLEKITPKVLNILDLGCGTGGLTNFLQKYGRVTGVEKNKTALALAKKRGLKVISASIEKLPLNDNQFDLVTIFDVLYHQEVNNLDQVLKEVKRTLKKNGHLLITDSAFNFLSGQHSVETQEKRRFTLPELKTLLDRHSFKIVSSSYIYFSIFPIIFIKRQLLERLVKADSSDVYEVPVALNNFFMKLLRLEAKLLKYFTYPLGSSLIILASK